MAIAIRKDNEVFFNYSTLLEECNYLYGVTPQMRDDVVEKLEKQKAYLKNTFLRINGEVLKTSLFDLSSSANVQPARYHGEIWNRVTALQTYANDIGFTVPVFMTITPRTFNKPTKQIQIKKNMYKLIDNKKFSGFIDGSVDYVKQSIKYISSTWSAFSRERIFEDIKKQYGERIIFMRTYEPHIDGTPHAHIVAFIPPEYKERFVKLAEGYFVESKFDIKTEFEAGRGGVIAYILKYILKSFENSKNGILDTVACWYSYHQIRRFTTSRTLIPLSIFRRVQKIEFLQDMYKATKEFKKGNFDIGLAYHPFTSVYHNLSDLKNSDYKIATISVLVDDGEDALFQLIYEKSFNIDFFVPQKQHNQKLKAIVHHNPSASVHIVGDLRQFLFRDGKLIEVTRSINNYSKFDLLQYYYSLDVEKCDLKHFGLVKNECIRRGLLYEDFTPVDNYNTDFEKIGA
ncbi:MAG: replication endonuclease [Sulfurospirillaceae bacterium]|nr:replication endonuclease [Sulfurospirillaceae bacterium]